jgi:hypothetical protein
MGDDAMIDLAGEHGEQEAGKYLGRSGRYLTEDDDDDDEGTRSWGRTWEALQAHGADEAIYEAVFLAWNRGWLG